VHEQWDAFESELYRQIGITRVVRPLDHPTDAAEYRRVFAALAQGSADGFVVIDEEEHLANLKLIVQLAEENRLPAIYPFKEFVQAGGLMSYGVDLTDVGRRVADMVGEILKGAKPGEIPIFQPTKFELAINLKTAKALGLTVPPKLLATADEVIE
jgi:putative ABC transport system substrate-binding protein